MVTITPSQLPVFHSPWIRELDSFNCHIAYRSVLEVEEVASQRLKEKLTDAEEKLISARVAGYLLLEFAAQPGFFGSIPSVVRRPRIRKVVNTMSSSVLADFSMTSSSACVRSTSVLPDLTLTPAVTTSPNVQRPAGVRSTVFTFASFP